MLGHNFLFKPGTWLGEGKINLNTLAEEMGFSTRWNNGYIDTFGTIEAIQEIEIKGLSESMHNQFLLSNIDGNKFEIELENQSMGKVLGKGLATDKTLAWEFRHGDLGFEGMEFYELQPDGSYKMHAEYSTTDEFRTVIDARIWEKLKEEQ